MNWIPPLYDPKLELRDHLPEDAWRSAIRRICARHDIEFASPAPFATGSDIVWSVGGQVVKLSAPVWRWQMEAEAQHLERVAGRLSAQTPALFAHGDLDGWPYNVMNHVPGVAIGSVWPSSNHQERARLAGALGRLTRELHALDIVGGPNGWDEFWDECLENVVHRHAEEGVPDELAAEVGSFLDSIGMLACEPRVFLHTELLDQHVLVEERLGRYELCGLIDFADCRVGPAEYDFPAPVEFLFRGEEGLLRSFLVAYGFPSDELTPELSERMLAWGLSHRYGRLLRMLRAVEPARPATLSELARLLYDVS